MEATSITPTIVTGVFGIITAVITGVFAMVNTKKQLNQKDKETETKLNSAPTVAKGLAVGYFHNFLKPVDNALKSTAIQVRFHPDEDREQRGLPEKERKERILNFKKEQVEIELIVPNTLSAEAFERAASQVKDLSQAEILMPGANRGFKINCELRRDGSVLVITDVVRPYFAIKYYAEDFLKMERPSSEWVTMEVDSLKKFQETLEQLRSKGEGVGTNRLAWKAIG